MTDWNCPFDNAPDSTVNEPAAPKLLLLKLPDDPGATKASATLLVT